MSTLSEEDPLIGAVLAGQFRIVRLLGAGGMGSVYLADQLGVGRQVVIKLMLPGLAESGRLAELEERFQREARLVAQLNHPNLVQLYTFGRCENGQLYLAMEFVPGRTLRQVLAESGAVAEVRVLDLMDQMCAALHEAHAIGIIHRDLKPDNVMLTRRRDGSDLIKVLDFGIAKPMQQTPDKALTATGAIFGTPQYMAPEQVHARGVDQRTDVYALGLIAYELLAGAPPFEADSAVGIMMKHASARPIPPSERRIGLKLGEDTERVIARCLEKEPARRFTDMPELQAALRAARQRLLAQPLPHRNPYESGVNGPPPEQPSWHGSKNSLPDPAADFGGTPSLDSRPNRRPEVVRNPTVNRRPEVVRNPSVNRRPEGERTPGHHHHRRGPTIGLEQPGVDEFQQAGEQLESGEQHVAPGGHDTGGAFKHAFTPVPTAERRKRWRFPSFMRVYPRVMPILVLAFIGYVQLSVRNMTLAEGVTALKALVTRKLGISEDTPDPAPRGAPPGSSKTSPVQEDVDPAVRIAGLQRKHEAYVTQCFNRLTERGYQSRARYASWVKEDKGPLPSASHVYGLYETTDPGACKEAVEQFAVTVPMMPKLHMVAQRYLKTAEGLRAITQKASRYYDEGDYEDDGMQRGQELHRPLVGAFYSFTKASEALATELDEVTAELSAWYEQHGSAQDRPRLAADTAARKLSRLGNVDWRKLENVDLKGFRRHLQRYEGLLNELGAPDAPLRFLASAKELARRIQRPDWTSGERSTLAGSGSAWMVSGSPSAMLNEYNRLEPLFAPIARRYETPVALALDGF